MARFVDAAGNTVPAHIAKINGILQPGYREVLAEGEYSRFNIMSWDAAPSAKEPSIDERLRAAIQLRAEQSNQSYTDWLANAKFAELEKLAHDVVTSTLREASGHGVAAMFSNDTGNAVLNDALRRAVIDAQNKTAIDTIRQNRCLPSAPNLAPTPSAQPATSHVSDASLSGGEFRDFVRNNRYSN
ncbi:hypothetical protein [Parasphingorhabdus sp.]|jgi:hypothetical protein|uniref:hypothetical protein n=1 Tax=Parasphingorhabdus sp. TaxID=2709688 RepID=UPI0039E32BA1